MSDLNETCTVCGKDLTNTGGMARLYHDGKAYPVCCPLCMDLFQRAPKRFAGGERPKMIVEELLAEMQWKEKGHW
jgi:YHS domain-containing protein